MLLQFIHIVHVWNKMFLSWNVFILTCAFCLLIYMQCSIVVGMVVKLVYNILAVWSVLVSVGVVLEMLESGVMVVAVVVSVDGWMVLECMVAVESCCRSMKVLQRLDICHCWMLMVLECMCVCCYWMLMVLE